MSTTVSARVAVLRDPATIRARAGAMLALAERDALPHFTYHPDRLSAAVSEVLDTIRENYPDLRIPYHARWRHFAAGGTDRWARLAVERPTMDKAETLRLRGDLCIVSVLLDAGAGAAWRYVEPETEFTLTRSEGLAVASLDAFRAGLFSSDPARPLQADSAGLEAVDAAALARAFQVTEANPLEGLEGRAALLRALGAAIRERPDLFGSDPHRPGGLVSHLAEGPVSAPAILAAVLDGLGPIWPGRIALDGVNLGDVWRHDLAPEGLIPFHKLSQWLAYSLAEIFEDAGIPVSDMNALTGLPEYRNGGLMLDSGLIALRDPALAAAPLPVDHPAIVEWRALTVALLDRVGEGVRSALNLSAAELPLARVLEGGTWAAGRRLAARLRGGTPPIAVISDGTVF
ncbi:DUF1688 family protein [Muricoccus radiodurans]|uniref:DUF1688 family protein n=1 Tax=Muricoccus radiodurans TaxID=2231721 RepID=UPI003CF815A4